MADIENINPEIVEKTEIEEEKEKIEKKLGELKVDENVSEKVN